MTTNLRSRERDARSLIVFPIIGAVLALIGIVAIVWAGSATREAVAPAVMIGLGTAIARQLPATGGLLVLVGGAGIFGGVSGSGPAAILAVVALLVVSYACGRHGRILTRILSAVGLLCAAAFLAAVVVHVVAADVQLSSYSSASGLGVALVVYLAAFGLCTVGVVAPWVVGFLRWSSTEAVGIESAPPRRLPEWLHRSRTPLETNLDTVVSVAFILGGGFFAFVGASTDLIGLSFFAIAVSLRRSSPAAALALAWFGAVSQMSAIEPPGFMDVGVLIVLYATAAYGTRPVRTAGLVSAVVGAVVASAYLASLSTAEGDRRLDLSVLLRAEGLLPLVFVSILSVALLGLSWTAGLLVRTIRTSRDTRAAQLRAETERSKAEVEVVELQERNRIARDMHDVVAHSLAVVIAQADGARYLRETQPEAVDQALTTISTVSRDALGDVRQLLAQLRHSAPAGPQPGYDDLGSLLDQSRAVGVQIVSRVDGDPISLSVPEGIAVYRIAQEALTNAMRHGDVSRPVSVTVRWSTSAVTLEVVSALLAGAERAAPRSPGHGLAGMRERAVLVGGTLEAGETMFGYRVFAAIPLRSATGSLPRGIVTSMMPIITNEARTSP